MTKQQYIFPTLIISIIVSYLVFYIHREITIRSVVDEQCGQYPVGDELVGCVIDIALEKNNAKYCKYEGIFSPYPGICMDNFAERTRNKDACFTIAKPRYKESCLKKFE